MHAFLSYATPDKHVAGALARLLEQGQLVPFLAHEDIEVSVEWRSRLLEELASTDLFICLLSGHYLKSSWCLQESGIAASRKDLVVIPLSLDGTISPGFIANVQAARIDPESLSLAKIAPAIVQKDFNAGIDFLLELLRSSDGFRTGEENMRAVLPYVERMVDFQVAKLLNIAATTYRVNAANLCVSQYLPPLITKYGHLASQDELQKLKSACRM